MEPKALPSALRPGDVPERIPADDLVLRRWQPEDCGARFRAIAASFDHLHPWMEWGVEPPTEQQHQEHFERDLLWPNVRSYSFGILDAREDAVLGTIAVHDHLGPGAVEIGYWCHADHVGQGVTTKSARALTRVLLSLAHIDRVEIHCDEANARSVAIARRLAYRLDRVEEDGVHAPAESGKGMIWVKERDSKYH